MILAGAHDGFSHLIALVTHNVHAHIILCDRCEFINYMYRCL